MLEENEDDIKEFLVNYPEEIKKLLNTNISTFKVKGNIIVVEITKENIKNDKE